MTEKRFTYIKNSLISQYQSIPIQKIGKGKAFHCQGLVDELNKLWNENEQLKSDNNRLVNETAKVVAEHQRKVFELIDEKINLLENDYKKAVKSGMPSNSVYGEIELLEELKKELQE